MVTFDASPRETCVVRETRTNTPLQALALMNDVTYVEAARNLGQRMMREGGLKPDQRIEFGFRTATSRAPDAKEREVLLRSFHRALDRYQTDAGAAGKLLSQGDSKPDAALDPRELAAYATVASLILNMDEAVTKE
jgi:hypothetical protein